LNCVSFPLDAPKRNAWGGDPRNLPPADDHQSGGKPPPAGVEDVNRSGVIVGTTADEPEDH
jgi:hypothetical protein